MTILLTLRKGDCCIVYEAGDLAPRETKIRLSSEDFYKGSYKYNFIIQDKIKCLLHSKIFKIFKKYLFWFCWGNRHSIDGRKFYEGIFRIYIVNFTRSFNKRIDRIPVESIEHKQIHK